MRFDTRAIHAAQDADPATGALIPPICQTSTFVQEAPGVHRGFDYSRTNNPTRQTLERVLADLEGGRHAAVFASGLAAENAAKEALNLGVKRVHVRVQGPGSGRESAIQALQAAGLAIRSIKDVTPIPHNGCRPPKRRRV